MTREPNPFLPQDGLVSKWLRPCLNCKGWARGGGARACPCCGFRGMVEKEATVEPATLLPDARGETHFWYSGDCGDPEAAEAFLRENRAEIGPVREVRAFHTRRGGAQQVVIAVGNRVAVMFEGMRTLGAPERVAAFVRLVEGMEYAGEAEWPDGTVVMSWARPEDKDE